MKVSEITLETVMEYGVYEEEDKKLLEQLLVASKSFVKNYTGLDDEAIDNIEDISIAVLGLVNEFYNNRDFTSNSTRLNPAIRCILGMHSINHI